MTGVVLAQSSVLLAPWPSAVQAVVVLALVCLATAREAVRQHEPGHALVVRLTLAVRLLAPLALLLLVVRLVVILR